MDKYINQPSEKERLDNEIESCLSLIDNADEKQAAAVEYWENRLHTAIFNKAKFIVRAMRQAKGRCDEFEAQYAESGNRQADEDYLDEKYQQTDHIGLQ